MEQSQQLYLNNLNLTFLKCVFFFSRLVKTSKGRVNAFSSVY